MSCYNNHLTPGYQDMEQPLGWLVSLLQRYLPPLGRARQSLLLLAALGYGDLGLGAAEPFFVATGIVLARTICDKQVGAPVTERRQNTYGNDPASRAFLKLMRTSRSEARVPAW